MIPVGAMNAAAAFVTVAGQVLVAVLAVELLTGRRSGVVRWIGRHALLLMFAVALAGTAGSSFYSEIVGYPPCILCWWQRMFLFPQAVILGLALYKNDWNAIRYSITLSAVGAAVAAYHYLIEWGLVPSVLCPATGPNCAQRFVFEFGYISIPMMALTAFLLIIVIGITGRRPIVFSL